LTENTGSAQWNGAQWQKRQGISGEEIQAATGC
jgi:hypothetical protein